jgi:hypothetical protein
MVYKTGKHSSTLQNLDLSNFQKRERERERKEGRKKESKKDRLHACNPSYLGGRDQEDYSLRTV